MCFGGLFLPALQLEGFHPSHTIRSRFSQFDAIQCPGRMHLVGANCATFMSFQFFLRYAMDILKPLEYSLTACQLIQGSRTFKCFVVNTVILVMLTSWCTSFGQHM